MLSRHGSERVVVAGLAGPLELAVALVGAEGLMDRLLFHPDEARALLQKTSAHFVRWANRLFADGLPLGVLVGAFCNADVLTPELATSLRPMLVDALSQVRGPMVFHHGGGRLARLLTIWKDMPAVVGYYMDHRDDLKQAREAVGETPVLLGNLNGPGLSAMTPEALAAQAEALLLQMDADPRFVLGTSGADIPLDVREETLLAIPRAIARHAADRAAAGDVG